MFVKSVDSSHLLLLTLEGNTDAMLDLRAIELAYLDEMACVGDIAVVRMSVFGCQTSLPCAQIYG